MKKKILIGIAALMIAAAAAFHVQNVAFGENESYATLESIGVMAEAGDENGCGHCGAFKLLDCAWTITYIRFDGNGNRIELGRSRMTCNDCAYNCDFSNPGNCTSPDLCPKDQEIVV